MWTRLLTYLQNNSVIIWLSNPIKIGAIWTTDFLNWIYNPFDEITRAPDPKYQELLFVKAKKFENDLIQNFLLYGTVWNYRIPFGAPTDTGDQILNHGVSTAYWAIKYSMTKDPDDLVQLNNSVTGLQLHQTIHGEAKRRIIRGFRPMTSAEQALYTQPTSWTSGDQLFFTHGNWVIEDSPSNDSASGHLFGIYHAWKYGPPSIQAQCYGLIRGLADELVENNYSLINADGSDTEFGQLIQGVLTDPLRLSLCLAVFKVAEEIIGGGIYQKHYLKLRGIYGRLALYAKVKLWWWDNDNDTPRAAMQLFILAELEADSEWFHLYVKGLARVWRVVHKTGNTFVAVLNNKYQKGNLISPEILSYKNRLLEFTLEDKQFDVQKINSTDTSYLSSQNVNVFNWNGNVRSSQPLPMWMLGAQDNFWQRNLNSVDNWIGQTQATQQFNGMDFLSAYIIGRKIGIISDKE
jgi:hypothetical protein